MRARGMRFGIFDHIDANGMVVGEQYAQRLRLVELYEKLGFTAVKRTIFFSKLL